MEVSIRRADGQSAGVASVLLEAPMAIPGYRLEQVLERRLGSWTVYRATEVAGGQPVALTILGAQLNHDRTYGKRLLQDMRRLSELEHPNLVPVFEAGRAERGLFVASELPDAVTLEAALGRGTWMTCSPYRSARLCRLSKGAGRAGRRCADEPCELCEMSSGGGD